MITTLEERYGSTTRKLMNAYDNTHVYAVVMAGGPGTGLWPVSRKKTPKQFVHLFDGGTIIRQTVERIAGVVPFKNIFIITTKQHSQLLRDFMPDFDLERIIIEPIGRDTAPCIALATAVIKKIDPDAVTVVLPSDHLVLDEERFLKTVRTGVVLARDKMGLVTIGIHPDRPETRYGYIQVDSAVMLEDVEPGDAEIPIFRVKTFAEKPDHITAVEFLESQDFWWNSGVFIWHVDAISMEFYRSMNELYQDMLTVQSHLGTSMEDEIIEDVYSWIHPMSVDYGIMEQAERVYMLAGDFGWTDLGCWDEVFRIGLGRDPRGSDRPEVVKLDCENVLIRKPVEKAVVAIGLKDVIVVDTPDAMLICRAGASHDVKRAVDVLRRDRQERYL